MKKVKDFIKNTPLIRPRDPKTGELIYKDKYYTPQIEEFHIGFRYEIYIPGSNKDYKKETYSIKTPLDLQKLYGNNLEDGWVRTKYLDQKDIEELGWKLVDDREKHIKELSKMFTLGLAKYSNIYYINSNDRFECSSDSDYWYLYEEIENRGNNPIKLLLFHITSSSYGYYKNYLSFNIKNYSEMKKLMNQLNIKNDSNKF